MSEQESIHALVKALEEESAQLHQECTEEMQRLRAKCEQQAKEIEELKRIKDDFFAENTRYARGWKKADDKIAKQAAVLREAREVLVESSVFVSLPISDAIRQLLARIDSVLTDQGK